MQNGIADFGFGLDPIPVFR